MTGGGSVGASGWKGRLVSEYEVEFHKGPTYIECVLATKHAEYWGIGDDWAEALMLAMTAVSRHAI